MSVHADGGASTRDAVAVSVGLSEVVREWGRIGCIGFGGPPAHIALLRELCVDRRGWLEPVEFQDASAATGLLPGPGSTQMAIFCAYRVAGRRGALVGGLAFIVPGLILLLALAAISLQDAPPAWIRGLSAGAGAAVVAVVVQAGLGLVGAAVTAQAGALRWRAAAYLVAGGLAAALLGIAVVGVLVAAGLLELALRRARRRRTDARQLATLPALVWTAFKVGALSYGGGFVIIPLMQGDAVDAYGWMTRAEFLNVVALGQITPGPVVQTVAGVGYAAAGLGGGLLAALVAFAPSFAMVLLGGNRFGAVRSNPSARAFLDGAGPAAVGAIFGAAVPLLAGVDLAWQWAVLAAAAVALFLARRGTVEVLLAAGAVGLVVALAGGPLP